MEECTEYLANVKITFLYNILCDDNIAIAIALSI